MMVDIDHFKRVNDTYGHATGDRVLQAVGKLLARNTRTSDLIGRYGGEEYILFLSPVKPEKLTDIAEKLRRLVEEETKKDIPVTVSIGVAHGLIQSAPEREVDGLIQEADRCLYQAKEGGRNRAVVAILRGGAGPA